MRNSVWIVVDTSDGLKNLICNSWLVYSQRSGAESLKSIKKGYCDVAVLVEVVQVVLIDLVREILLQGNFCKFVV